MLARIPYRSYALAQIRRASETTLLGRRFLTHPEVFHPGCFNSTELFATYLLRLPVQGKRVLDMGTGSGAIGIFMAGAGADVVACDINPQAVELARRNASLNRVGLEVRRSDLFEAFAGERFDLILFNIPFYPKDPSSDYERAFYAGEGFSSLREFARQASLHLRADGRVIVIFSEDSGPETITGIFRDAGLDVVDSQIATKYFEQFFIVTLKPGGHP
jgi:HemK-related putative methylase